MTTPATVSSYDIGDLVRSVATFVGTDGVTPADPSTVMFFTRNEFPSVATYLFGQAGASIQRVATGAYAKDFTVDRDGVWDYHWLGSGAVQAAESWSLVVQKSRIFNL